MENNLEDISMKIMNEIQYQDADGGQNQGNGVVLSTNYNVQILLDGRCYINRQEVIVDQIINEIVQIQTELLVTDAIQDNIKCVLNLTLGMETTPDKIRMQTIRGKSTYIAFIKQLSVAVLATLRENDNISNFDFDISDNPNGTGIRSDNIIFTMRYKNFNRTLNVNSQLELIRKVD